MLSRVYMHRLNDVTVDAAAAADDDDDDNADPIMDCRVVCTDVLSA